MEGDTATLASLPSREERIDKCLFQGLKISFHGEFPPPHPPRDFLEYLILKGGGAVIRPSESPTLCIFSPSANPQDVCEVSKAFKIKCVSVAWLLDSISAFDLQDPDGYEWR